MTPAFLPKAFVLCAAIGVGLMPGPERQAAGPAPAETIFSGRFVTLDVDHPNADAIAVRAGRIVAVGSRAETERFRGPSTTLVAVTGVAVPGLADAHAHPQSYGELLESIDLHGLTKGEILARVAARVRRGAAGEWIRGTGWDQGHWQPPEFPTAADLDRVAPNHPVLLDRIDEHAIWVNSAALRAAGVSAATPDPPGGRIHRDGSGRPTGILLDRAASLVSRAVPAATPAQSERRLRAAVAQYAAWGLTSVHDAQASRTTIALYRKLLAEGQLPVRIYVMAYGQGDLLAETLARGPEIGLGDGRLTIRSFKIVLDGALGSRGAQLAESYADAPDEHGLETTTDEAFRTLIRSATARGFQVSAHAIGDRAVRRALDGFEASGPDVRERRFRIEHASVIDPRDRPRFASLGVIASMQPMFVGEYSRWADARVGAARASWVLPIKSMLEAGAIVPFGTDYPAADSGDPVLNLFAAVTRRGWDGRPAAGWHTSERVDVMTALRSLTLAPAFAAFEEKDLGALTVGRYADFTALSDDPRTIDADALRALKVRMTVVGGHIVYRADR